MNPLQFVQCPDGTEEEFEKALGILWERIKMFGDESKENRVILVGGIIDHFISTPKEMFPDRLHEARKRFLDKMEEETLI